MKIVKNRKDIITFLIIFSLTMLIFIPFITMHYATDTYNILNVGYKKYAINWSLIDGRIFMCIIGLIANSINLPINIYVISLLIISIAISCLCVIILNNIIQKYKPVTNKWYKILVLSISYFTIFNFMYIENLYFVECAVMAISILLYIISAKILIEKDSKYILKSSMFIILGVMCYQGTICIVFPLVVVFSILKNKNDLKQILIDIIKSGIVALIGVIFNILEVKIIEILFNLNQTRLGNISNVFNNINYISKNLNNIIINTCSLFPKYIFIIFLSIILIESNIYFLKYKKSSYNTAILILISIITILSSFIIFTIALTSFYAGRLRFSIGALIGIIYIYLYCMTDIFENKTIYKYILISILIIYGVFNLYNYEFLMIQHKKVNYLEKIDVEQINEYIKKYENNTKKVVKNISIIEVAGNSNSTFYKEIKNYSVLTYSGVRCDWSVDGVINFYTGRKLNKININNDLRKIYINKILQTKNYYICEDDTLYIESFMY